MKIDYQDRIDDYVQGKASVKERMDLEREIKENKELHDQLIYTQNVKSLLSGRAEKLKKMNQWKEDDLEENMFVKPAKHLNSMKTLYWISGIAAVLLVGFFAIQPVFIGQDVPEPVLRGEDEIFYQDQDSSEKAIDNKNNDELLPDSLKQNPTKRNSDER